MTLSLLYKPTKPPFAWVFCVCVSMVYSCWEYMDRKRNVTEPREGPQTITGISNNLCFDLCLSNNSCVPAQLTIPILQYLLLPSLHPKNES